MKRYRQALRNNATVSEKALWQRLRRRQVKELKFRRQHSADNMVIDFYCPEIKLAIELDGSQHKEPQHILDDAFRDEYLEEEFGIRVLRFDNEQVKNDLDGVVKKIEAAIDEMLLS